MTDAFLLYGTHEAEPESRILTAGPLVATLQGGKLGTIRFAGYEVLRAVSFLVRDKDWGTCVAEIRDLVVDADATSFRVRYKARYIAPSGAHLDCRMQISGDAGGELAFEADYCTDADFETARAGFTVLHPLGGVAGEGVSVEHGDGSVERSRWPEQIEPWQPFMDMRAISHRVADGIEAETRFSGDVFEMEDQRNWTDASYKTYVRPLALPWPYMVRKGQPERQSVAIAIRAEQGVKASSASDGPIGLVTRRTDKVLPEIGVGLRPDCGELELAALDKLADIGARQLIAHFDPLAGHGADALRTYAQITRQSGLKTTLELAVPCIEPLDRELAGLAAQVTEAGLVLDALFVSPSVDRQSTPPGSAWPDCPALEELYQAARNAFAGVRMGGGMLSYFTELNRKRVPGDLIDYVSHCTNPIVHAADDLSVMQSFEALAYVVKSARSLYPAKPYRIGPSTIAMRQNPYGSATKDNPMLSRIPMANIDPRHNGQFGAAWTLAYAATVASAGLETLTLSTLAGPFGILAGKEEPVAEGMLRPLAHVIAALSALSGRPLVSVETSCPSSILGLGGQGSGGQITLLLANITPRIQAVQLHGAVVSAEILDLGIGAQGFQSVDLGKSFELGPYACLRLVVSS